MTDQSTNMSPEWIAKVVRDYPCMPILDERGAPTGNFRTCPVRGSFLNIFERSKPIPPNTEGKYGGNLIFPLMADLTVLKVVAAETAKERWPTAGTPQGPKLRSPFKDQGEMTKYEGYVAGGIFLTVTADRQPAFVDQRMAPIVDKDKAYPGGWYIASIRPFAYDKGVNKGVAFGLQSLMFIADDKNLGGGGSNPNRDFAGISITSDVNPSDAFGSGPAAEEEVSIFG